MTENIIPKSKFLGNTNLRYLKVQASRCRLTCSSTEVSQACAQAPPFKMKMALEKRAPSNVIPIYLYLFYLAA